MPQTQWNTTKIKQCNQSTQTALLSDESTRFAFSHDFGRLKQINPAAVAKPQDSQALQALIQFAHDQSLPLTIRGFGLSQAGQSQPVEGGIIVSMEHFKRVDPVADEAIWVDANASWADLLAVSLSKQLAPPVLPYNCNLSIGGLLSAGGVGASSFKYGPVVSHVAALQVVDGQGQKLEIDASSPLFHACLAGQGRFAVIERARISLKPVKSRVKTWSLVYGDPKQWLAAIAEARQTADYLELFCSPAIMGAKLVGERRQPYAQWLYGLHYSRELDREALTMPDLAPWQILHEQEEGIESYYLRHNSRFAAMKMLGQWDLYHPWFECFLPLPVFAEQLQSMLNELPVHYANLVHVVPVHRLAAGSLKYPDAQDVVAIMILNPGIAEPLLDSCLATIDRLNERLLPAGGKRYLSGYLGHRPDSAFWQRHFGEDYRRWQDLKRAYDPAGIFVSALHPG